MATVRELIKRFEYLVDADVEYDMLISLFNEAQEDLSKVAGYGKIADAHCYANDPLIPLPYDFVDLVELKIRTDSMEDYVRIPSIGVIQPADVYEKMDLPRTATYFYEWFGDTMELRPVPKENGSLLIRYYASLPPLKPPNAFANLETDPGFLRQQPALRQTYHRLLPLYAAMRFAQNWKDALDEKQDFYMEYMQGKSELEQETSSRKQKTRSKTVYRTHDFL